MSHTFLKLVCNKKKGIIFPWESSKSTNENDKESKRTTKVKITTLK